MCVCVCGAVCVCVCVRVCLCVSDWRFPDGSSPGILHTCKGNMSSKGMDQREHSHLGTKL